MFRVLQTGYEARPKAQSAPPNATSVAKKSRSQSLLLT
jgi:hypothetical protein